jgi:hypothetical protein
MVDREKRYFREAQELADSWQNGNRRHVAEKALGMKRAKLVFLCQAIWSNQGADEIRALARLMMALEEDRR